MAAVGHHVQEVRIMIGRGASVLAGSRGLTLAFTLIAGCMLLFTSVGQAAPGPWERIDPIAPPDEYGFHDIEPDPRIPGRVYLGTDSGGLYRSENYGTSWTQVAPATGCGVGHFNGNIWSLALDRFNGTLYAINGYGCEQGVHRSLNAGVTWTQALPVDGRFPHDMYEAVTDPYLANHVLVATHGPYGGNFTGSSGPVAESFDGGNTWTARSTPNLGFGHYVMFMDNSSTWLLGTQEHGFYRTTNSGQTWAQVSTVNMTHGATQLQRFKGQWYVAASGAILKSTDGVSWSVALPSMFNYFQGLGADSANLYTRIVANGNAAPIKYSADGVTWQDGSPTIIDGPMQMAADSQYVYSSNWRGGVWRLPISGGSVTPTSTPISSTSTPTSTPVPTSTATASPLATTTATLTPSATPSPTLSPSSTPTPPSSLLCYESADGGDTIRKVAC